jgi:hypothetical protein
MKEVAEGIVRGFKFSGGVALLAALAVWAGASTSALAAVTFDLGTVITGDAPASSTKPWVTAQFSSLPGNQVELVLSAPNLTGREDVGEWLFNIDPKLSQSQLNTLVITSRQTIEGIVNVSTISLIHEVVDGVVRAGFRFDFDLGLPKGNPNQRFGRGDEVRIVLGTTLASLNLTEDTFNYKDGTGTYYSAAHVQNTSGPEGSGWIGTTAVPEPTTMIAGALMLLPFGVSTWRALRRNRAT